MCSLNLLRNFYIPNLDIIYIMSAKLAIALVIALIFISVAFAQENATTTITTTVETTISSTIQSTIASTTTPATTTTLNEQTTTTISSNKGACVIRDSYTNMPSLFDPDIGKGYAKKIKEVINTIDGLKTSCSKADYDELLQKYCAQNSNSVQQEVVVYGAGGGWETTSCGAFGCSAYYCASLGITTTTYACPLAAIPICESGYYVKSYTNQYGCAYYSCEPGNALTTYYTTYYDSKVCGNKICESGENAENCPYDCETRPYCGNKKCDIGEDYNNCQPDCPYTQGPVACPFSLTCKDGSTVPCKTLPDRSCFCEQCPVEIPLGCKQVTGQGYVNVVCESSCPIFTDQMIGEKKLSCEQNGGKFFLQKDQQGCEFPNCEFALPPTNPLVGYGKCPAENEFRIMEEKCKLTGGKFFVKVDGECKIGVCGEMQQEVCPAISESYVKDVENKCRVKQLPMIEHFDEKGCKILRCGQSSECPKEVPGNAYGLCGEKGGELIVKRDPNGCVVFSECVAPGDKRQTYVERPESVPDSSKLLEMAFKLEQLRIQLLKLAKEANDIADFYASTNSDDEKRYRRVADMFNASAEKVDEIKTRMKDRLEDLTIDDMMEMKHDIRYIKDVMMKDILYIMLSTSNDVKEITSDLKKNCGTDSNCFDRAFRICKPMIFKPEGSNGPIIEVIGLEGNLCVMKGELPEDKGPPPGTIPGIDPPYKMECKMPNYAFGINGPEDIVPYCTGNLLELMMKTKISEAPKIAPSVQIPRETIEASNCPPMQQET